MRNWTIFHGEVRKGKGDGDHDDGERLVDERGRRDTVVYKGVPGPVHIYEVMVRPRWEKEREKERKEVKNNRGRPVKSLCNGTPEMTQGRSQSFLLSIIYCFVCS